MSHGLGFDASFDGAESPGCRFGIGEGGGGESRSVDLRVTLEVSDAARGRAVKGLWVWRCVHISNCPVHP